LLAAADLDSLVTDSSDPDRLPYWAVLWESARGLARWVIERGGWADVPVLEVGCGLGLPGLAAAALGARVAQTDLFLEAVVAARLHAQNNHVPHTTQWVADWCAWDLPGRWPVILGSDVTYERSVHGALLDVLERALEPDGSVYLSDPGRPMSLDFLTLAERRGWTVGIDSAPTDGVSPVFLYTLTRGSSPVGADQRRLADPFGSSARL
jgi:predicted nicotinamide N-methyase